MLGVLLLVAGAASAADSHYNPEKLAALDRQRCEKLVKERAVIDKRLVRERQPYNVRKLEERRGQVDEEYARYGRCAKVMAPTPTPPVTAVPVTPAKSR